MLRSKRRKLARLARERDEREAPPNDLSETRSEQGDQNAPEAPPDHSSETRSGGHEGQDGQDAPPDHLSETRSGRRSDGKAARQ